MRINNNVMALNAHRQLSINQTNASKSMERLSSGMRINRAGDDAAGLAISEKNERADPWFETSHEKRPRRYFVDSNS